MSTEKPESDPIYLHEKTVTWGESDPFGLVYYPHITAWMNDAEHAYLSGIGLGIDDMIADDNTTFVMGEIQFRFLGPVSYGDRVRVALFLDRVASKTIHWSCQVTNADTDAKVAVGEAVRVYAHISEDKSLESRVIPDAMRNLLTHGAD